MFWKWFTHTDLKFLTFPLCLNPSKCEIWLCLQYLPYFNLSSLYVPLPRFLFFWCLPFNRSSDCQFLIYSDRPGFLTSMEMFYYLLGFDLINDIRFLTLFKCKKWGKRWNEVKEEVYTLLFYKTFTKFCKIGPQVCCS